MGLSFMPQWYPVVPSSTPLGHLQSGPASLPVMLASRNQSGLPEPGLLRNTPALY